MNKFLPLLLICLASCVKTNQDYAEEARKNAHHEQHASEPTINDEDAEASQPLNISFASLNEAIEATKPDMADFADVNISKGALIFAYWATEHLNWADLQKIKTTKHALVMKDPDAERGKRICFYGSIVEIQVDSSMPNKAKIYLGGMFDNSMRLYRFIATGSTGELVGGSNAKFCGIVTGKNDYQNSGGGVAHAVHLVGMFDLPENNKNAKVVTEE